MNIGGNMKKKDLVAIILLSLIFIILFIIIGDKKSIIGKWKSIDAKDEYYYVFNKDKTCLYEMTSAKLNCTYKIDDNHITILYEGNEKENKFEYSFNKNNLIIKDITGKEYKFIKN